MFTRSKMTTKLKIVINLAQVLVNVSWEMSKSAVSSSVQSLKYLSTGTKHCGAKSCQRQSASHIEHSHHDVFPGVFKPPCSFAYAAYQYQEFQSEKFFDSVPCILLNMCFIKKKKKKKKPIPAMSTKSLHDAKSSVQVWSLFFLISGAFGKTDHSLLLVSLSVTSLASLPFSVFDSLPLFLYHCFSLLFGFSSSFSLSVLSNQKILDFWSLLTLSFLSFCDRIYSWYLNYHLLTDNSYLILLLLWLSRISPVRLCATTKTAAYQTPPSLGFSRQEHWSGLPFPSPMHESEKWKVNVKLLSHIWLFVTPWTSAHQTPPSMGSSRQEYWNGLSLPSPILS